MLSSFPFAILVGACLGFLSGLGTGGGSLLILWLTLVLGIPQEEAGMINLLFFLPSALLACVFRWKQGQLSLKKVLPAILAGSILAAVCSYWGAGWNVAVLRKLFGALLVFTGIRELLYRPKKH